MPLLDTRLNKVGNFLKAEMWPEKFYCRRAESVNTTTAGADAMEAGAVIYQNDKTGDWLEYAPLAFDPALDNIGIVVDDRMQEDYIYDAVAGSQAWTDGAVIAGIGVLVKGPASVRRGGLKTVTLSAPQRVIMYAALEAVGIEVVETYSVNQSSDLPA